MVVRLQKIDPEKRQKRFYRLSVMRDLFGDWCLCREWGRIGSRGGQQMFEYFECETDAEAALTRLHAQKTRRGYVAASL